jgi:hypothetical protein
MSGNWEVKYNEWKRQFPWYKRILYVIGGYPPFHGTLSEKNWKEWENRFDDPQYDWKNHSGGQGPK